MKTVIIAGGTLRTGSKVTEAFSTADLLIAADSGALTALQTGYIPDIIVGDFDSLPTSLSDDIIQKSRIVRAPVEKDETDTELAIQVALAQGATELLLLGALGGDRFEHTFANIQLLASIDTIPFSIIDGPSTCWLLRGPGSTHIDGQTGDLLSLFPLTAEATGLTTSNLYYPLLHDTLSFGKPRGVSNVLTQPQAEVTMEQGLLLLIHTRIAELNS